MRKKTTNERLWKTMDFYGSKYNIVETLGSSATLDLTVYLYAVIEARAYNRYNAYYDTCLFLRRASNQTGVPNPRSCA